MHPQKKAYIYAGITISFWSTVATAFKIALRYLDILHLLLISSVTSLLILLTILAARGKLSVIKKCTLSEYGRSALLGALNPFLYYIVLFKAYSLLPAQVAQPLNMIWPIVLVFLSVPFLKHKVSLKSYIALFISFTGVYFISSRGEPLGFKLVEPLGIALALGSSFIWSFFWIFNVRDKRDEEVKLFLNFLFATFYIAFAIIFAGGFRKPTTEGLFSGIYVGTFEMGLSFVFWLKALSLSRSADLIGSLVYLSPFVSLIFIHFIVGEIIYGTTIIGLILIVTGILVQKLRAPGRGGCRPNLKG
ncbi:MAG: EamA/RhaT family transporter [Spirochaetes bacterium]|nr:MAG: EamA/RhaT family transporter [Spirochaetota bacterium]